MKPTPLDKLTLENVERHEKNWQALNKDFEDMRQINKAEIERIVSNQFAKIVVVTIVAAVFLYLSYLWGRIDGAQACLEMLLP